MGHLCLTLAKVHWVDSVINHNIIYWKQVEKAFLQNEGGYRDGLELQKEGNKECLLSKATQNCMTPSLYLCLYDSMHTFNYRGRGLGSRLMSLHRDGFM